MTKRFFFRWLALVALGSLILSGCTAPAATPVSAGCTGTLEGTHTIEAWFHSGQGGERDTLKAQVEAFNQSQSQVKVELVLLPEGNYNDQVQAAAASGGLPDLLDFDGPLLYNYAWNQNLIPLDNCASSALKADLLPSIIKQGTYDNKLYGIGTFDSGLGLYARKSVLEKAGVRIPKGVSDAWTAEEFTAALQSLRQEGFQKPLDLKYNYGQGEWFTYGFSPIIQSAGGDLIDRQQFQSADGVINGDASVKALTTFQSWFTDGLVHFNDDDTAFVSGQAAISWVGHWMLNDYKQKFGDDLIILPLPDFGKGSKTGMGSWQWGITTGAKNADAAWSFLSYLMQTDEVLSMANANGAVPALKSAAAKSDNFSENGIAQLYVQQLESSAVPRPQTPAYPTITSAYAKAIHDISQGKDVKTALDEAAKTIKVDIEDNKGYPVK